MIHLILAFSSILCSDAFSISSFDRSIPGRKIPPLYAAKKQKKSKTPTSGASGGFGKSATSSVNVPVDDYSVFPALDQQIEESLIPSPPELQEVGALPVEVYDRLNKIYGFPNFNFQNVINEVQSTSFNDLISSVSGQTIGIPTLDLALSDTMASTTAEKLLSANPSTSSRSTKIDAIANLPQFSEFRVLHVDPLVLAIDNFFTADECDRYVAMSENPTMEESPYQTRSKTVGKDSQSKAQRTSTTWFHHYKNVPELMSKASRLLGLDGIDHWEEAQTVRYRRNEKFTWHLDALAPTESSPSVGGQRTATLLVYLTDLAKSDGGATIFRDLSQTTGKGGGMLKVQPRKGSALLFFPAAGGIPNTPFDIRTLHCGEAVDESSSQDKWISQLWLRKTPYTPSAPPGNQHDFARSAISDYCLRYGETESCSGN